MEKKKSLTIDHVATRERIKADGRTVAAWGRLRGFAAGTMQRIFNGSYPYQDDPNSEYQKILHALRDEHYLVQQQCQRDQAA